MRAILTFGGALLSVAVLSWGWYSIGYDHGRRDVLKVWNDSAAASVAVARGVLHTDNIQIADAPLGANSPNGFRLIITGCFADGKTWKPRGSTCYSADEPK